MTEWDDLWEVFDFMNEEESLTQYETIRGWYDDLRKIKTEGDKLQEENKTMLDTFKFATDTFFDGETTVREGIKIFKMLRGIEDNYIEATEKLEAIEKAIKKYESHGYPDGDGFAVDEIREILGID